MLRLHDYWRSSAAYRVRIALNLKGLAYEAIHIDLIGGAQGQAANRTVNAQGLVPSLVLDGGEVLTQSLAILQWLDDAHSEPPLWPGGAVARARASARALVVVADVHPLNNLRVLGRLQSQFDADAEQRQAWYRHWIELGLAALEEMADGPGPFLGGHAPDVSDVCLVPQLFNARRFEVDLSPYPKLVAADAAANELPAFQTAHPERVRPD